MRIGIYIPYIDPQKGGEFTFSQTIYSEIVKYKSNHEFIIFTEKTNHLILDKSNIKYVFEKKHFLKKIKLKLLSKIKKFDSLNNEIKKNHVDLMWFPTPNYKQVNVPYYFTVWDLQHRLQPYFPEVSFKDNNWENRENLYSEAIRKASFIITGTNIGKNEICQFYNIPEERIIVNKFPVPNYIKNFNNDNAIDILEKYNLQKNQYLLYPAQFWPHKNHIVILLALKILIEKNNINLKVVFTGSDKGNKNYILRKVSDLKLENQVKFLDFISIDELRQLYINAFSLVFASFFGPDNLPPLEALALGCPVICSEFSGAREQLKDSALFFNPKNEEELSNCILKLYYNNDLRVKIISNGKILIKELTPENYVKNIINHMDNFYKILRCWDTTYNIM